MSLAYPTNTLAHHMSRVFVQHRDMSNVMCEQVALAIKNYDASSPGASNPDDDAIVFYAMNHYMSLIQQEFAPLEPLPPAVLEIVNKYFTVMNEKSVRAFYYLLLICIREFRHNKSLNKHGSYIGSVYGEMVQKFFQSINGGEPAIHAAFLKNPPEATIGQFVNAMQWGFYNCTWGSSFGGPAWGKCNDCLSMFVAGQLSAETMLDTNWTLAHNNGPIFNKGIYYESYSHVLKRVLDIQRSGQIPEAIAEDTPTRSRITSSWIIEMNKVVRTLFPGRIGQYVDWYSVEALGGIGSYKNEQAAQVAAYGESPIAAKMQQIKAAAKAAAAKKLEEEKIAKASSQFEYMPGEFVQKIIRKAAA